MGQQLKEHPQNRFAADVSKRCSAEISEAFEIDNGNVQGTFKALTNTHQCNCIVLYRQMCKTIF